MSKVVPQEGQKVMYMTPGGGFCEARIEKVHSDSERSEVNLRYDNGGRMTLAENVPYSTKPQLGTWGRPATWTSEPPRVEVA